MQVNYLNLLIADLPMDVQDDINEELAKEFGPGVDLSNILGINMASGGDQKLKDIMKSRNHVARVTKLF